METITANNDINKERSTHVLLVDDEYNIVFVNQMVLEEMGYVVQSAHSGMEAVALIEKYHDEIDVIVTDYLMPGMDGIELAVETGRYAPDIPVILYTGRAEFVDENLIAEAGIAKVIVKPFRMKDLDSLIKRLLNKNKEESL